jgi:anhydro-N-acetylmuramic acid kinase
MTLQIGHGSCIAAKTGIPVVYDFRVLDVALGGQGAPLVPIGDKLLYGEYDYCLNLGGIANISFDNEQGRRVAFDICPVNMVLNRLAAEVGKAYDDRGSMARGGVLKEDLFNLLENLSFYRQSGPKSLGKEWVDLEVLPLMADSDLNLADRLHTFCHHIASRIAGTINKSGKKKVLVTGGGAFNDFLIGILRQKAGAETEIIVPDNRTVMFKEAIIFAFLGYLRVLNLNNCLASVTGATKDSCGGVIALP